MPFCLQRRRSSLFFGFYLMIIANYKSQQNNVLQVRGTKSMTKNKPEGHGAGSIPIALGIMEDFWELRGSVFVFTRSLKADRFPGFFLDINKLSKILKDHSYVFILCANSFFQLFQL